MATGFDYESMMIEMMLDSGFIVVYEEPRLTWWKIFREWIKRNKG